MVGLLSCLFLTNTNSASFAQATENTGLKVELGLGGRVKLGCWQPFLVTTQDQLEPMSFEMTVLDGDETPICYRGPLHAVGAELNQHQGYFKLGRGFGDINLKLFDRDGVEIAKHSVGLRQLKSTQIVGPTDPIVVTIEAEQDVLNAIESTSIGDRSKGAKVKLGGASQLPTNAFCYEGVDAVFLVASRVGWLESVSHLQWDALEKWVGSGGSLVISLDPDQLRILSTTSALKRLIPGEINGTTSMSSSKNLDAFASSATPFVSNSAPTPILDLKNPRGVVAVEQDGQPVVVRAPVGLGEVVLVTFRLDEPQLTQWSGFKNLVYRLQHRINLQEAAQNQRVISRGGSVIHPGFDDLVGQLRVPLDQFSKVSFLSFNWVAVLIGLYILCIGPADYFLLRRFTGRMEMTWISFPLITLFFCGLAIWIANQTRADQIQLNQLELVDIDSETGLVRGTVWTNLYSPSAGAYQISLNRANRLNLDIESDLVSWQGLPGKGYGGMQSTTSTNIARHPYLHTRENLAKDHLGGFSKLEEMPLYVSSTKSLLTQYSGKFNARVQSNLRLRSRNARLEGTLVNPFDFRLKNCRLLFDNHAYELSNPLEVGEAIAVESEMKERTLVGYLTRRRTVSDETAKSSNTQNVPWDIGETRISRIADMLMFYGAAGGSNYTAGLTHSYQNYVDMSDHLNLGRAILVGEVDGLGTSLNINGQSATPNYDQSVTIVRIVLPVSFLEMRR
jgi:hypothetical protein